MQGINRVFSGFSVSDIGESKQFYETVLGLRTESLADGLLQISLDESTNVLAYAKGEAHQPATFTILNFAVSDVDAAADDLIAKGVEFIRYDGFDQDEKGISRGTLTGQGPDIAWFTDPSGNVLAVMSEM